MSSLGEQACSIDDTSTHTDGSRDNKWYVVPSADGNQQAWKENHNTRIMYTCMIPASKKLIGAICLINVGDAGRTSFKHRANVSSLPGYVHCDNSGVLNLIIIICPLRIKRTAI